MCNGYQGDRRRFQRLKANISVFYRVMYPQASRVFGDSEFEASMLDIGEGGMGFLTRQNIPVHTTIMITFILFKYDEGGLVSFDDPLEVTGEVCSNVLHEDGQYRLGIRFDSIKSAQKSEITDFAYLASKPASIF